MKSLITSPAQLFLIALVFVSSISGAATEVIQPPTRKDPKFLSSKLYEPEKAKLAKIPQPGSAESFLDYGELLYWQETRTEKQCEEANSEAHVGLDAFFGPKHGILSKSQVEAFSYVFELIRTDADYFIQGYKAEFPRPRPYSYIKALKPCVQTEASLAFPSGHATLSRLVALVFSDAFPAKAAALKSRADQIGTHRVLSGMHHRSDIEAGKKLAERLHAHFRKSIEFQKIIRNMAQSKE